jgi:hypothetical protein
MAVAAVDRQRACRARQRDGKIQITVALNELIAKLIEARSPSRR